jgi:TrkA-N domain
MSILLVAARGPVGVALVERLVAEGDDVRVVEGDAAAAARWRELGAHVAAGRPYDADLVERAAQGVRTLVIAGEIDDPGAAIAGAVAAGVGRIVWLTSGRGRNPSAFSGAGLDYVVLTVPAPRWPRRSGLAPAAIAEAVDAADDLAGNPRLELDLGAADAWARLGLSPPGEKRA